MFYDEINYADDDGDGILSAVNRAMDMLVKWSSCRMQKFTSILH